MRKQFEAFFKEKLDLIGLKLTDNQIETFYSYYLLLAEWNKVMNLTAIIDIDDVILKHFIDSLSIVSVRDLKNESIIDVGTGAGFPGIPLKIAFPDLKVTLLDSLNKRVKFLNEVIVRLELKDIKAVHGRAEDYGRDDVYREQFDLVLSRAVANLATLSEYCLPYARIGGFFIPYKSGDVQDEVEASKQAIRLLASQIVEVKRFSLAGTDIERSFIIIKKKQGISKKYPRKAGLPSKEPLS